MSIEKKAKLALSTLSLDPFQRSSVDIEELVKATSHLKFFSESPDRSRSIQWECCKIMTYSWHGSGESVSLSSADLQILLQGSVSLSIPSSEELPNGLSQDVGPGMLLDEFALLNSMPCTATCRTDCFIMLIPKQAYEKILQKFEDKIFDRIEMLKSLPAFQPWSRVGLQKISSCIEEKKFKKNQLIFKEGDPVSYFYVIISGEVVITKDYVLDVSRFNKPRSFATDTYVTKPKFNASNRKTKTLQIVIKQENDMFGFEEVCLAKPARESNCRCLSLEADLLLIPENEFNKILQNKETKKVLEAQSKMFQVWVNKRVKDLQKTERFKEGVQQTPLSLMKSPPKTAQKGRHRNYSMYTPLPVKDLPSILKRNVSISQDRQQSPPTKHRETNQNYFSMFDTEIQPPEVSKTFYSMNTSLRNYTTPAKLRSVYRRHK